MSRVQRKDFRKDTNAVAYLYSIDGWPLGECEMKDVSNSGAKLVHKIDDEMPPSFFLSLSRNGQVRRLCEVAWKKENQIGVRFVKGS